MTLPNNGFAAVLVVDDVPKLNGLLVLVVVVVGFKPNESPVFVVVVVVLGCVAFERPNPPKPVVVVVGAFGLAPKLKAPPVDKPKDEPIVVGFEAFDVGFEAPPPKKLKPPLLGVDVIGAGFVLVLVPLVVAALFPKLSNGFACG